MMLIPAFLVLGLTVSLSLSRPTIGRIKIEPAGAAVFGAVLIVATGLLPWSDLFSTLEFLSLPIMTIISLMVITLIAERAGFFQLLAWSIAKAAKGSGLKLFTYIFVMGTMTGTLFTNDAAVLIFTPMVYHLIEEISDDSWKAENKVPYYFAVLYVANLVGAFIISNPINIIVSGWFGIGFAEYAVWMIIPAVVSMVVTYYGMRIFFRRMIPERCQKQPKSEIKTASPGFMFLSGTVLLFTLIGFFSESMTGIPAGFIAAAAAVILIIVYLSVARGSLIGIAKGVGWDAIIFVIGIFIVVSGLRTAGFTDIIGNLIMKSMAPGEHIGSITTSFIAGSCSSFMNNHPVAGVMAMAVRDLSLADISTRILAFSALIGGDLGPKMLPIGSLAALMWFRILRRRGVEISYWQYIKIGVPVTLAAILLSVLTLNLEYVIYLAFFR
jgi:arsenical pump membrane protein